MWAKVFILAIILTFALSATECKKKAGEEGSIFRGAGPSNTIGQTPKGVILKGRRAVPQSYYSTIDEALAHSFSRALTLYPATPRESQFIIGFWPRSNKCTDPGFLLETTDTTWDNLPPPNDFDKDPRVGKVALCIAGINFYGQGWEGDINGEFGMIVVDDASTLFNVVWFESEHAILFAVDPPAWHRTIGPHSHPIIQPKEIITTEPPRSVQFVVPEDIEISPGVIAQKGAKVCALIVR